MIQGFGGNGIEITGPGGNVIEGNFIGTNAAGTGAQGNAGNGIQIVDSREQHDRWHDGRGT